MIYVALYLLAIVLANLSVTYFGPPSTIVNAFLFIGLDITARDRLHEAWHKSGLVWKMGLLILSGSLLSWFVDRNAAQIAVASCISFAFANLADTIIYQLMHKHPWQVKVNGSNVVSAAVDSVAFPTIAFGSFMPLVTLGQFAAKVLGGFVWAQIIVHAPEWQVKVRDWKGIG